MKWVSIMIVWVGLLNCYANPIWFLNRDLSKSQSTEIVGYGMDEDLSNALVMAKTDIATQIKSSIHSSIIINKNRMGDDLTSSSTLVQSEKSDMNLEDIEIIKQEFIDKKWFVAVKYENIPDTKRFVKKVLSQTGGSLNISNRNQYLSNTMLGKEIDKDLPKNIPWSVMWLKNELYLNSGSVYQRLNQDDYPISELFITYEKGSNNSVKIQKYSKTDGVIISDENVFFEIKSNNKFVSIFVFNPEGHVFVLENNTRLPLSKNLKVGPYQFFRKNDEERPTMFVSVFSSTPIDNSYFRIMQGNEDRESYGNGKMKFDSFIDFLDGKEFVSQKMLIK